MVSTCVVKGEMFHFLGSMRAVKRGRHGPRAQLTRTSAQRNARTVSNRVQLGQEQPKGTQAPSQGVEMISHHGVGGHRKKNRRYDIGISVSIVSQSDSQVMSVNLFAP